MTERAVILMPFIRSGFDTDVFHAILIRVMNDMNEGINNISIAIEESAKGVTNVAQEISQLVTAISAITVQANENKNLSEDLSDEVAKFEKV